MSEYCHHCGTTISEDIATLCPLCASKPDSLRREEIDEFAAKLKTGAIPAQIVDGKPMYRLLVADESNTANSQDRASES